MGSVGDCYDNAMAESLFATLETELIDLQPRRRFRSRVEASREILATWKVFTIRADCIQHWIIGRQ